MINNTIAPSLAGRTEAKNHGDVAWVIYRDGISDPLEVKYGSRYHSPNKGVENEIARRTPLLDPYGSVDAVPADALISVGFTLPCGTCGVAVAEDRFLSADKMRVFCTYDCKERSRYQKQASLAKRRRMVWVAACRIRAALRQLFMNPPSAKEIAGLLLAQEDLSSLVSERLEDPRRSAYIFMATDPSRDVVAFALSYKGNDVYRFMVFSPSSIYFSQSKIDASSHKRWMREALDLQPFASNKVEDLDPSWWNDDWDGQRRINLFDPDGTPIRELSDENLREALATARFHGVSTREIRAQMRLRGMSIPG